MKAWGDALRDSALSGLFASAATAGVAAWRGQRERGTPVTPLNAVSHVLWGDRAAADDRVSTQRTLAGLAVNHGAATFWALLYELLFGDSRTPAQALRGAAAVAAIAYVVDYHVVPRRLTPGYELALSGKSLAAIYAALATALAASTVLRSGRRTLN